MYTFDHCRNIYTSHPLRTNGLCHSILPQVLQCPTNDEKVAELVGKELAKTMLDTLIYWGLSENSGEWAAHSVVPKAVPNIKLTIGISAILHPDAGGNV